MADKKISQLTDGTSLQSGDFVVVARSGDNFKVDPTQFGSDISLGDNVKAIFGDGSDLQIYHDGSNSYIAEGGTGNLQIQGQNLSLEDATGTRFFLGIQGGETRLYNQGNQKVAITATGIDVTGTVTADGLTVENPASGARSVVATLTNTAALSAGAEATIVLKNSGQSAFISGVSTQANSGMDLVFSSNNSSSVETKKITISEDGDISFYEDTGTTPKFFWDASAESLGIGTTSPDGTLHVFAGNNYNGIDFVDAPHALLDNGTVTNHTAVLVFNSSGTDFANKKSGITGGNYYSNNHGLAFFGDISGKDRTATPDVFINDSGNVGIGTTSPSASLEVATPSSGSAAVFNLKDNTADSFVVKQGTNEYINVDTTNGAEVITLGNTTTIADVIVPAGNVGIGTSSPATLLHVNSSTATSQVRLTNSTGTSGFDLQTSSNAAYVYNRNNGPIIFGTNDTEQARVDATGNLLVSTTNTSPATNNVEGICLRNEGHINVSRASGVVGYFNRKTDDGTILDFRKDGVGVGSIGSSAGTHLSIGNGDTGIAFLASVDAISPYTMTGVDGRDAAIDLGTSTRRFKDLYLSGGVYLGGTGAANLLDDYETGTWTPVIVGGTTAGTGTYTAQEGIYTKVGNLVTVTCWLDWSAHTGTGLFIVTGLPFSASAAVNLQAGSTYASNFDAGTSATQLIAYVTSSTSISFRGFVNNATRAVTNINSSGQLGVTISYRAA